MIKIIEFLPILTTILAMYFTYEIAQHYSKFRTKYLLWWTIGIFNYGLGTMSESINILIGWNEINLKFWYITGALLGGFTIAQGTVYLLMPGKFGDRTTILWTIYIAIAMACVILTPAGIPEDYSGKMTGASFKWEWVRYFSPFINLYAFIFSFGGAIYAANKYFQQITKESKFIGCIYISFGALLTSIGGVYSKMGYINVLFITELIGLILIYMGYRYVRIGDSADLPD